MNNLYWRKLIHRSLQHIRATLFDHITRQFSESTAHGLIQIVSERWSKISNYCCHLSISRKEWMKEKKWRWTITDGTKICNNIDGSLCDIYGEYKKKCKSNTRNKKRNEKKNPGKYLSYTMFWLLNKYLSNKQTWKTIKNIQYTPPTS